MEGGSDTISTAEEQNGRDSPVIMKRRRLESGVYPCDLCSKVFQKGSSLLRHKYEHTGMPSNLKLAKTKEHIGSEAFRNGTCAKLTLMQ